jgi:hypothetical protein
MRSMCCGLACSCGDMPVDISYDVCRRYFSVIIFLYKSVIFHEQATATAKKRGEELLDMIQLDTVNFTLLELAPVPYEVYMKIYGCSNTLQVISGLYITPCALFLVAII